MENRDIYKIINLITAILIGICGVINSVRNIGEFFSFSSAVINMYYVALAVLLILLNYRDIEIIETEMHFLYSFFGRGLTYLFVGLTLWSSVINVSMISSIFIVAVSVFYIVQYFKKAEPEF